MVIIGYKVKYFKKLVIFVLVYFVNLADSSISFGIMELLKIIIYIIKYFYYTD